MALIKKQLLAKEDMLLSADNTPVSQARAGTTVSVHPVNASVIPYDENRSIAEAIQGVTYTHPLTHPVSIIDGSSNPSKFVKTDALGNTGFDGVAWADIDGKPGTYTPSAHEHSLDEVTSGSLVASRIIVSENRQFITAEQATQLLDMEVKSNRGIPNGYAPLNSNGKINSSFLSDLNLVEVFTPVDLASMLALTSAQPGDIAYRQDNSTSYMLVALPSSTEANWKSLNTGSQIISVNGQTGIVSLNTSDIAEATNLYFTNERVDDRVAALLQAGTNITLTYNDALNTLTISANDTSVNWSEIQSTPTTVSGYGITDAYTKTESNAALSLKANLASPALTGTPTAPTAAVGTSTTQLATTAFVKAEIANDTYSKADVDARVVHKTGDETISGIKTFSSSPIVPTPTTSTQAANKAYVDTKQANLGFTPVQQGTGIGQSASTVKIGWSSENRLKVTVDGTDIGNIVTDRNGIIEGVKSFSDGVKVQNQNVSPFSGFKNYIINGGFDVWQRGTSDLSITSGLASVYPDMWRYANTTGRGTLTLSKSTLTYNGVAYNSYKATVSSALSTSSGVAYAHYTSIEDKSSYMLIGKELVISFLMEVNYAGNYSFSLRKINDDGGVTTSFLKLIPCVVGVNKIEIKIPSNSAYISSRSTSGRGLNISIGTFSDIDTSTVEGWQSGNHASIASAYNWRTQVGAYINIAQVQLEEGSVATPFENRPYGLELSLCQRYLPSANTYASGQAYGATIAGITFPFKVQARTNPTGIIASGTFSLTTAGGGITAATSPVLAVASTAGGTINFTSSSLIAGNGTVYLSSAGNILFTGCEL